jgi:EAL and modified HD-GYP domain-containing signal transduction protein
MEANVEFSEISDIIKHDSVLSYRLLRVVNSAYFGVRQKVGNISQALSLLGLTEIKKWATLVSMSGAAEGKPNELVIMSLIRARFLETLMPDDKKTDSGAKFMFGLLSLMDVMLDQSMEDVVEQANISTEISAPLLTGKGEYADLLNILTMYESGEWDRTEELASAYHISLDRISVCYMDALRWAGNVQS